MENYGTPTPVPQNIHPLEYWLNVQYEVPNPPSSALSEMAFNYGQKLSLAYTSIGAGISAAGAALLTLAWPDRSNAFALVAALVSVLLLGVGFLVKKSASTTAPKISGGMPSRGPGSLKSGIWTSAFFVVVLGVILSPVIIPVLDYSGGVFLVGGLYTLLATSFMSVFLVPAYFIQNARTLFLKRIRSDRNFYEYLSIMSTSWVDPRGSRDFGPL